LTRWQYPCPWRRRQFSFAAAAEARGGPGGLGDKVVGRLEPEDIGESGLDTRRRVEP